MILFLLACADRGPVLSQPPVQAHLVVHVDPLAREGEGVCETEGLDRCGTPVGSSWLERTANLQWLVSRWQAQGRAADIELGPEMSLAWADDPDVVDALATSLADHADPYAEIAIASAAARASLASGLAGGVIGLGVHVHTVLPDGQEGRWGSAPKGEQGPSVCEAWSGDPMPEADPVVVEEVAGYGVASADRLASLLDAPLSSYTGHLPRSMSGKMLMVTDPESLDPSTVTGFSSRFAPGTLGSAYSECLIQTIDHPPFEVYPADADQSLLAGDGPVVVPGERVVGSMDEHLGAPTDTSAGAAGRRVLQLMLNWRYAGVTGQAGRPWTWTWHTHLFQLDEGSPDPMSTEGRELKPRDGGAFRGDVEAVAGLLDGFAAAESWGDVEGEGGSVVAWTLPEDLETEGSSFSYGEADRAPPTGLETDLYPYLPLVAEQLVNTHLVCRGERDEVEIWGLERCEGGWSWGGDSAGYHCTDGTDPLPMAVLVPVGSSCLSGGAAGVEQAAALDDAALGVVVDCGDDGLDVPEVGLLVRPSAGSWFGEECLAWP